MNSKAQKIFFRRTRRIRECIRYYPPNIKKIQDPKIIFEKIKKEDHPNPRKINLFISFPFCKTPCGICPFNIHLYRKNSINSYVSALKKEIKILQKLNDLNQLQIETIEIGGGTLSDLNEKKLEEILKIVSANFNLSTLKEFSLEVKPILNSFKSPKINLLKKYKVNRISLGVQSTNPKYLQILNRGYTPNDVTEMIKRIQQNNFILNIDMMYRLPGQTLKEIIEEVNRVRFLKVDHISWFPYIPFSGTPLATKIKEKKLPSLPNSELYFKMFKMILKKMIQAGYYQYTPYHFSLSKDKVCQYHVNRWKIPQKETLGIGAGAFSFFNNFIYTNAHNISRYLEMIKKNKPPIILGRKLNKMERVTRLAVLGIKFFRINTKRFQQYTGIKFTNLYSKSLKVIKKLGLIQVSKNEIKCTLLGRAFNNDVAIHFSVNYLRKTKHPQGIYIKRKGL
jgi:oxygen-independent coproporphyrinogen-3 oxidase